MSLLLAITLLTLSVQSPGGTSSITVSGVIVDESTQNPIAGADVEFMKMEPPRPAPSGVGASMRWRDSMRRAVTDRDGRYTIERLEAGRYRVQIHKAGYARLDGLDARQLVIEARESRDSFNFALKKGAVIVGRVVDGRGEPVSNVQVLVLRRPPASSPLAANGDAPLFPAGNMAQTNDLGEFRIFGLAPHDEYFVRATATRPYEVAAPATATVFKPTYFPAALDSRSAQSIPLAAGQTSSDVIIRMIEAPARSVTGVVVDESGRPVANGLVRLTPATMSEPQFMTAGLFQTHTDQSGAFIINGMTSGSYKLIAIAPFVSSGSRRTVQGGSNGGSFTWSAAAAGGVSAGGGITSEMMDGVTTEYRDDAGTTMSIALDDANIEGISITVRRRPR
jgi:protocatechuate 3,4-dioxygenase beta subunit